LGEYRSGDLDCLLHPDLNFNLVPGEPKLDSTVSFYFFGPKPAVPGFRDVWQDPHRDAEGSQDEIEQPFRLKTLHNFL